MIYNIKDFDRNNGEELVFIKAFIASGEPHLLEKGGLDVEFKMNGQDVDFKKFAKSFVENFDHMMKLEAARILKEKYDTTDFDKTVETIKNLQEVLHEQIKEKISSTLKLSEYDVDRVFKPDY